MDSNFQKQVTQTSVFSSKHYVHSTQDRWEERLPHVTQTLFSPLGHMNQGWGGRRGVSRFPKAPRLSSRSNFTENGVRRCIGRITGHTMLRFAGFLSGWGAPCAYSDKTRQSSLSGRSQFAPLFRRGIWRVCLGHAYQTAGT